MVGRQETFFCVGIFFFLRMQIPTLNSKKKMLQKCVMLSKHIPGIIFLLRPLKCMPSLPFSFSDEQFY